MSLTFDAGKHEYQKSGRRVPSVTQLLGKLHSFAGIPQDILKAACERGTAVHLCCEYHDHGDLDESSIDPKIAGYVDAWRLFTSEKKPQWTEIEKLDYHPLGYAGAWDRGGSMDGEDVTIDIKTAIQSHPVWGCQLSAYNMLRRKPGARRFTVQLRKDGKYKLIEWKSVDDWPLFLALLTLHNFQARNEK